MTVLEAAMDLASLGYNVFPSIDGSPAIKKWPQLATTDANQIVEWFSSDKFTSVSICPKDTCVVIDIDIKNGKDGARSLKTLIDNHGLSKDTMVVQSKSGGLHLYYKYPKSLESKHIKSISGWIVDGRELDGVDIRGNKGQIVAPSGDGRYKFISRKSVDELAELPESLIAQLPVDKEGALRVDAVDAKSLMSNEPTPLNGIIPKFIPKGDRHQTLLSLTASWARKVPYSMALIQLKEAISRCEGNDIKLEDYLPRLDDAYSKFQPVINDKLQRMLDTLVYVTSTNSVYDLSVSNGALIRMSSALVHYGNIFHDVEITTKSGDVTTKRVSTFNTWKQHPHRATVMAAAYKPTSEKLFISEALGGEVVNTYVPPVHVKSNLSCKWFTDLVDFLWGEESDAIYDFFAHIVQNPTIKVNWCPIIITTYEGLGKNVFFNIISHVLGLTNTAMVHAGMFGKTFNKFLANKQLVLINELQEIRPNERHALVSKLKSYITESVQEIEEKGRDTYTIETYANFIVFSNYIDAIDVEDRSRRMHVHINRSAPRNPAYYQKLHKDFMVSPSEVNLEAISSVRQFLLDRDISHFNHAAPARDTESKHEVVMAVKSDMETQVMEDIANFRSIFISDVVTKEDWQYYVSEVLYKGRNMSVAQEKHIRGKLLVPIRQTPSNPVSNRLMPQRQFSMDTISSLSDKDTVIRGPKSKCYCYSVRNHEKYSGDSGTIDVSVYITERQKIFFKSNEHNISIIK